MPKASQEPVSCREGAGGPPDDGLHSKERRKQIEEELLNAKKLESIGILAGGIAHDFNNLLFVILGNIGMAKMWLKTGNPTLKHLVEAERACMRAKDLTQKFITFSSGGGPVRSRISMREMVSNLGSLILSGSNVRSVIEMPEGLWNADVDENQMRQALCGIISNAKEAMPKGGTLRIRAENAELTAAEKADLNLDDGRYLRILISDEGVGIPEENLSRIFDPYFSTKYRGSRKGMGFGLAIAHSVIKGHRGTIRVESTPGEGTVVTILIPASKAAARQSRPAAGILPAPGRRILVMDDEEMLNDVIKTMLEHLGYEVDVVPDGETAVAFYAVAANSGRYYDAVILDLTVKGGMGGKETVCEMLKLNPDVKAIVSSGYSSDPVMSRYTEYGFKDVLKKPYALEQLSAVLKKVLEN